MMGGSHQEGKPTALNERRFSSGRETLCLKWGQVYIVTGNSEPLKTVCSDGCRVLRRMAGISSSAVMSAACYVACQASRLLQWWMPRAMSHARHLVSCSDECRVLCRMPGIPSPAVMNAACYVACQASRLLQWWMPRATSLARHPFSQHKQIFLMDSISLGAFTRRYPGVLNYYRWLRQNLQQRNLFCLY